MKQTRKQQLIKMDFGALQSTDEYKKYCDEFVVNGCLNMTMEIDYILKKSLEDNDAPLSYDDIPSYVFDKGVAFDKIKEEIEDKDEEEQKELFKETNEEHNRRIKTIGDYEVFLNSLDEEEIKEIAEDKFLLDEEEISERVEIMQWFTMDDRILYQLEKRNEVVLNNSYWGRQCCGQSITMDGVIIDIFKEWFLNLDWIEDEFKLNEVTLK